MNFIDELRFANARVSFDNTEERLMAMRMKRAPVAKGAKKTATSSALQSDELIASRKDGMLTGPDPLQEDQAAAGESAFADGIEMGEVSTEGVANGASSPAMNGGESSSDPYMAGGAVSTGGAVPIALLAAAAPIIAPLVSEGLSWLVNKVKGSGAKGGASAMENRAKVRRNIEALMAKNAARHAKMNNAILGEEGPRAWRMMHGATYGELKRLIPKVLPKTPAEHVQRAAMEAFKRVVPSKFAAHIANAVKAPRASKLTIARMPKEMRPEEELALRKLNKMKSEELEKNKAEVEKARVAMENAKATGIKYAAKKAAFKAAEAQLKADNEAQRNQMDQMVAHIGAVEADRDLHFGNAKDMAQRIQDLEHDMADRVAEWKQRAEEAGMPASKMQARLTAIGNMRNAVMDAEADIIRKQKNASKGANGKKLHADAIANRDAVKAQFDDALDNPEYTAAAFAPLPPVAADELSVEQLEAAAADAVAAAAAPAGIAAPAPRDDGFDDGAPEVGKGARGGATFNMHSMMLPLVDFAHSRMLHKIPSAGSVDGMRAALGKAISHKGGAAMMGGSFWDRVKKIGARVIKFGKDTVAPVLKPLFRPLMKAVIGKIAPGAASKYGDLIDTGLDIAHDIIPGAPRGDIELKDARAALPGMARELAAPAARFAVKSARDLVAPITIEQTHDPMETPAVVPGSGSGANDELIRQLVGMLAAGVGPKRKRAQKNAR